MGPTRIKRSQLLLQQKPIILSLYRVLNKSVKSYVKLNWSLNQIKESNFNNNMLQFNNTKILSKETRTWSSPSPNTSLLYLNQEFQKLFPATNTIDIIPENIPDDKLPLTTKRNFDIHFARSSEWLKSDQEMTIDSALNLLKSYFVIQLPKDKPKEIFQRVSNGYHAYRILSKKNEYLANILSKQSTIQPKMMNKKILRVYNKQNKRSSILTTNSNLTNLSETKLTSDMNDSNNNFSNNTEIFDENNRIRIQMASKFKCVYEPHRRNPLNINLIPKEKTYAFEFKFIVFNEHATSIVQLVHRRTTVTNYDNSSSNNTNYYIIGEPQEFQDNGVCGQKPIIEPGKQYTYSGSVHTVTPRGCVELELQFGIVEEGNFNYDSNQKDNLDGNKCQLKLSESDSVTSQVSVQNTSAQVAVSTESSPSDPSKSRFNKRVPISDSQTSQTEKIVQQQFANQNNRRQEANSNMIDTGSESNSRHSSSTNSSSHGSGVTNSNGSKNSQSMLQSKLPSQHVTKFYISKTGRCILDVSL